MPPLVEQLQAIRIPPKLRDGPDEELDSYIRNTILNTLKSVPAQKLAQGDGIDPLTILDPFQDTLSYLYVLVAQLNSIPRQSKTIPTQLVYGGELWQRVALFINVFDPLQMRYAGHEWIGLVDSLLRIGTSRTTNQTSATVLLVTAMSRLDPSCGTFTSAHGELVRLCLETETYHDALPVLHRDVHSLPRQSLPSGTFLCSDHHLSNGYITLDSRLTAKPERHDLQEYYLLGAMVYIACKDWSRAQFFLEHVLCTPTNGTASGLMLEAHQKWLLVGLMRYGKEPSAPKVANSNSMKNLRSLSKPYQAVADAFQMDDRRKLLAESQESQSRFVDDGNLGLVQDVLQHHQRLSVRKLGQIYAAVPVESIGRDYGSSPAEAEDYVRSLIREGHLRARIETDKGGTRSLLRFPQSQYSGQESKPELQAREELVAQTRRMKVLAAHVGEADRRLSLSREYMEHVRTRQRREESDEGHDEMAGMPFAGRPPSEGDEDESMMTDVG